MHACALRFDLHLRGVRSLKEKRRVLRPMLDRLGRRSAVSVAEVEHQDLHQRAAIGVALVASSDGHLREITDEVRRLIDSAPDVDVIEIEHCWLETAELQGQDWL